MTPNQEQMDELAAWEFKQGVDFWVRRGADEPSRIMVSPDVEDSFLEFLKYRQIENELIVADVESTLQADKNERLMARTKRSVFSSDGSPDFTLYMSYEEMESYTVRLAQQYPNLVKRDVIGKSIEGRDIFGMRVSSGSEFGKKPIIFIDAGIHAREWVGHHSVLFLLDQLVTNATVTAELVDKVDWVIVPNANPDGLFIFQGGCNNFNVRFSL